MQQVQKAGKLRVHDSGDCPPQSRQGGRRVSEHKRLLAKRPGSAAKLRKLTHRRPDSPAAPVSSERSELPPIDRPRGNNFKISQKRTVKGDNHGSVSIQSTGVTFESNASTKAADVNNGENLILKNIQVHCYVGLLSNCVLNFLFYFKNYKN